MRRQLLSLSRERTDKTGTLLFTLFPLIFVKWIGTLLQLRVHRSLHLLKLLLHLFLLLKLIVFLIKECVPLREVLIILLSHRCGEVYLIALHLVLSLVGEGGDEAA
jgi:amino acid permease